MYSYNSEYQKMTKEIFKNNELYNNKEVLKEFSLLGCIDSSYKNDLVPSFHIKINNEIFQIMLSNSTINDIQNELFNETIIYNDYDQDIIFSSSDIWEIWSIIKSNIL